MRNSETDTKPQATAKSRISAPIFFLFLFITFLLILLLLLTSQNLSPFLPPSLYRDHFSLRTFQVHSPPPSSDQPIRTHSTNTQIPISPIESPPASNSNSTFTVTISPIESPPTSNSTLSVAISPISVELEKNVIVGSPNLAPRNEAEVSELKMSHLNGLKECNLYMGKWVRDESGGYPLYELGSCPYVDDGFVCKGNGRPDSGYLSWRWKPDGCELPRFNAADFLERLRGKRLTLVGDSMNRNQFESMLCILREGLTDKTKMYEVHGYKITKGRGYYVFKFVDYNCTVEFIRSHFLVREGVRRNAQGNSNPTLSIDRIDKSSAKWKRADILVFNTGHWWVHGKISRGKNYFKEGDQVYPQFEAIEAYRRSMKTWGEWIDRNMNPEKQLVFYRAYSTAHFRGGDWDSGGTCNGETEPIPSGAFLSSYPLKMKIVEEVIHQMRVPVVLLNITRLTNFRKDGHPSIYGKNVTAGVRVSLRRQDCSHWCLPGVPDAWNELIYATLVYHQTPASWSL